MGRATASQALLEAVHRELELRADALDERFGLDRAPLTQRLPRRRHALADERRPGRGAAGGTSRRGSGIAAGAEVTLEANPGADELGDLAGFRAAGVNRLSLGAQSMDDGELRRLGRRHRPADVVAAVGAARAAGIGSLSLDLLTDIPGQTLDSWRATLDAALDAGARASLGLHPDPR